MVALSRHKHTLRLIPNAAFAIFLLLGVPSRTEANDGDPVAIRYWPGSCISIETMWNFHIAFGVDAKNRAALPRTADVEFVDDYWAASGSDNLVLDRKPNENKAVLKPSSECPYPSPNAIRLSRSVLTNANTGKSISMIAISVDGVTIVNSDKSSALELIAILKEVKELPKQMHSIDAFLIDDGTADQATYQTLQGLLKARVMVLGNAVKFDKPGDVPVQQIAHNTLAISKSGSTSEPRWIKLSDSPWTMEPALADLFAKKEAACKSSRAVFASLTVNQLNFQPGNGTHTPRWNAEHMMGRELIFFSQIYNAVDSSIPIMDLNPKQMPPDYRAAHADWSGFEEAMQMERVEAFTRRFAYLLEGMDLNKTAKGSAFWTPQALLKQMVAHYMEHTANVVKKKELPDWPKE